MQFHARPRTLLALFALAFVCALALPVRAAPVKTENATAELVADVAAIAPGEAFQVALKLTPRKGWHTYWRNPGDSGMATTIEWSLPAGFTTGDIQWPAPHAMPYGPLTNYGYGEQHWLLVTVTPPADLAPGDVMLKARADWLVCEDICIPEGADLTLALKAAPASVRDPFQTGGFKTARQALPVPFAGKADFRVDGKTLALRLEGAEIGGDARFFPFHDTLIQNSATQQVSDAADGARLLLVPMGSGKVADTVDGVLTAGGKAYEISAERGDFQVPPLAASGGTNSTAGGPSDASPLPVWQAVLFAFAGGILLNLMPCVFPVLSLKALAVVKASGLSLREKRMEGLLYTAGVMVSFLALAGALLAFRAGGAAVGWGFQLQSPEVVAVLAVILFAVGLSLAGYFELAGSFTGLGQGLVDRGGALGAFSTGVLATIVATPCTAPFMASALGAALLLPPLSSLLIFAALGFGLAFPMLLISEVPAIGRLLPRPGPWMDKFRQFLAFPVFATVLWLATVLGQQAGVHAVAALLAIFLLLTFAIWLWRIGRGAHGIGRALGHGLAVAALIACGWLVWFAGNQSAPASAVGGEALAAERFDPAKLAEYRNAGEPVFVNFTAAWCITCLANERVALSTEAVANRFREDKVRYMKGDWTLRDPEITKTLAAYGRSGVPLYLYFAPGSADAIVLPQLLTPDIVLREMNRAEGNLVSG
ncbi:protein-disulfide reductase DsbD domain-containing protein [Iodidimonas sp. SYSU 1G8]|uniref:protein-disulfide reductase DsbD family protein n=1 Tax=Iodidimonas sp. SYSU 1G8 TaxID=3133967 RepID=UPI0031FE94E2